ncbi:Crp/Fnr family transcriptional regulator [Listeria rocourtiae]|uniref:Crp/Fnr family transcriptional regulator n=1 Tax=Listeria rocourtiae TaxID=647910 RepID=UPI00162A73B4|nr:Crp/Fnr family transcriptional regulator [Listeria rocourtiae]MBC1434917.1 Crp/Fnr family transcriptional regulator [Listeria rocourtiae]
MIRQQAIEMYSLYNSETVTKEFNKQKFYCFLQRDLSFPIEGTLKKLKKHEFLMKEKDTIDEICFIRSGCVMAMKKCSRVIDFYTEEDIVGFDELILTESAKHSFKAISDEVIIIKYKKSEIVEKILNAQEGYLYHYVHMQNQIRRLLEKEALLRLPSEKRVGYALLQIMSGSGIQHKELITFPKHINKGILAKYTNLNRNTVTTVLQKLQEESIIQIKQRNMYINIVRLQSQFT